MTTSVRAAVRPRLLVWARERGGLGVDDLVHKFPKLTEWESGERTPTLKQLEGFARATRTPVGFLFLPEPPEEQVPIPDYRTMGDVGVSRPSPDLLDTIFQCQQRQEWYRDFAQVTREDPVAFVGSLTTSVPVVEAAEQIRGTLRFGPSERGQTWSDALRTLVDHAEELGVLVMVSGVVGANTHRKLDPDEFRGFALVDRLAPLVFVNGADTKAAQIFTLAHELVHLFLGETALDDADLGATPTNPVERWCNQVAAEVLVPVGSLRDALSPDVAVVDQLESLARTFKVSTLVVLRRIHDAGRLSWDEYWTAYQEELTRVLEILGERSGSGGNFFNTQPARVSKRFARAVIVSTLEGQTLHRDAFQMLGSQEAVDLRGAGQPARSRLMAYLLDTNVFIEAKNRHYGFDFCPAFWDWIDHAHQAGTVFSIDKVAIELDAVDDDLATWASERPDAFFLEADAAVVPSLQATSTWANGAGYEPHLSCPELPGPSATVRRFTV